MKGKSTFLVGILLSTSVAFLSCTKKEAILENYISFKYNGTAYSLSENLEIGSSASFTKRAEAAYVIFGMSMDIKTYSMNVITISTEIALEGGKSYDIYSASPYASSAPAIHILFTSGMVGDETMVGYGEKIGVLSITEKTEGCLSGTFYSKMKYGAMTDGKFSVAKNKLE
jgi:hypothetical protein